MSRNTPRKPRLSLKYSNKEQDVMVGWGPGCQKADANLVFYHMCTQRMHHGPNGIEFGISLVDDLKLRGYDISTIRFTIDKASP